MTTELAETNETTKDQADDDQFYRPGSLESPVKKIVFVIYVVFYVFYVLFVVSGCIVGIVSTHKIAAIWNAYSVDDVNAVCNDMYYKFLVESCSEDGDCTQVTPSGRCANMTSSQYTYAVSVIVVAVLFALRKRDQCVYCLYLVMAICCLVTFAFSHTASMHLMDNMATINQHCDEDSTLYQEVATQQQPYISYVVINGWIQVAMLPTFLVVWCVRKRFGKCGADSTD
mmetsp:Transcript_33408/g.53524  ORF Transcript_33408/g.53524 Transcript_33408/m.53524 type:complete len:228 (-) Transcript_33408:81-764(-)